MPTTSASAIDCRLDDAERAGSGVAPLRFIHEATGMPFVYPGHPLVIATVVMLLFADGASAYAPRQLGVGAALSDERVPGAGGNVGAALDVLNTARVSGHLDSAVELAHDYWERSLCGVFVDRRSDGREQALRIEQRFREVAGSWIKL